jgi:predicted MarR family transcription regulator
MNNKPSIKVRLLKGLSIAILSGFLISCAAIKAQNAEDKEQLLAAAGFKMQLADTPEKQAHLKTLTQQKIVTHEKDGKNYYVYADATTCQCLYIGQDSNYQNFQQLQLQKNIAQEQQMSAEMNENAAMNWGMWGPGYGMGGFYY